jgi:nucleoid DNA-binding protein
MNKEKLITLLHDSPTYKKEFITYLAQKHQKPKRHYSQALEDILEGIKDHLAEDKSVCFLKFGTFYTRLHKGGTNFSFRTKQKTAYAPFKQAAFKASTLLKQAVAGKK